jgi:hypothetical protein
MYYLLYIDMQYQIMYITLTNSDQIYIITSLSVKIDNKIIYGITDLLI